jgi:hypothetical protein
MDSRMPSLCTCLLAALICLPAMAQNDEQYRQMIDSQRKAPENWIKRLQPLPGGKQKMSDMLRIEMNGNRLAIKSPLLEQDSPVKGRNQQLRADIEGFEKGFTTIMVQNIGRGVGGYYLQFNFYDYSEARSMRTVSINAQQDYLAISRNLNAQNRNESVSLQQSFNRGHFGQADGVTLNVYAGDNTGRMRTNINVSAPDFASLRRTNAQEVNLYLRPLLRDLRLESLFIVDDVTAWQVFADEWKMDQSTLDKVKVHLTALDAEDYKEREAAQKALIKLGPDAAMVIYHMSRDGLSAEQNTRLDTVVSMYAFLPADEARKMRTDLDFLLDCLYSDTAQIREIAHKYLQRAAQKEIAFDLKSPTDARFTQVENLRAQLVGKGPTTKPTKG